MKTESVGARLAMVVLGVAGASATVNGQTRVVDLGALPGHNSSVALALSGDGLVVFGQSWLSSDPTPRTIFRWTEANGMQSIVSAPASLLRGGIVRDASYDGSVIVGSVPQFGSTPGNGAFRYTADGGLQFMGWPAAAKTSYATGVSSDGSVVVGYSDYEAGQGTLSPFRWTAATGRVDLPPLFPGVTTQANACSSDGNVIVGTCEIQNVGLRAFRWTATTGYQLITPPPEATHALAVAVSADGTTFGGHYGYVPALPSSNIGGRSYFWTTGNGASSMPLIPAWSDSTTTGVSANGSVVVGWGHANGNAAWVWTPQGGTQALETMLSNVPTAAGWTFQQIMAVSDDGRTVTGNGTPHTFLARLPGPPCYANCDGSTAAPVLTANDFQCFLNAFSAGCP